MVAGKSNEGLVRGYLNHRNEILIGKEFIVKFEKKHTRYFLLTEPKL